jgi:UDP-GlcNAc:undecaprenyl-phosphate GlcNAc-1-phosphate transferase
MNHFLKLFLNKMYIDLILFVFAIIFVMFLIRVVIKICLIKNIFDNPVEDRKFHKTPIPNIGGLAIYFTIHFCFILFYKEKSFSNGFNYIFCANTLLFLFGLKDDLVGLSSTKRFAAQLIAGFLIIFFGKYSINDISFLGIASLNNSSSFFLSLLFFVFITNAFNLIDGINGLLGSVTLLSSFCFAILFYLMKSDAMFSLSLILLASILGFLYFNFGKAKIFMGSSGAYIIGALMYVSSIYFINNNKDSEFYYARFSILFSILALPVYDTIRVFSIRLFRGKSPFTADANHIHHLLLKLNLSHSQIVILMLMLNVVLLLMSFIFIGTSELEVIALNFILLLLFNLIIEFRVSRRFMK